MNVCFRTVLEHKVPKMFYSFSTMGASVRAIGVVSQEGFYGKWVSLQINDLSLSSITLVFNHFYKYHIRKYCFDTKTALV